MDNYEHEVDLDNGGYSLTAPVSLQATTAPTAGSSPAGGYPASPTGSGTYNPSKMDIIQSSRERKYKSLTALKGLGPNDLRENTYVEMEGSRESMANKIDNDYSIGELNSIISQMYDEYGVMETDQGLMVRNSDGQLVPYEGNPLDLASLYTFATKDGNTKIGTHGGINPRPRYSDETLQAYKASIGPLGVDRDNLLDNKIMPYDKVRLAEALIHGNRNMLKYRAARQISAGSLESYQELRDLYGTGATEVYRPIDGDDSSTDFDSKELWAAFKERFNTDGGMQLSREELIAVYDAQHRQREMANYGFVDRVANAAKGAVSTAALELLVNPADMAMELFGSDISDEEGKAKMVNDFFGYKGEFANESMKEIEGNVTNLYNAFKNGTDVDYSDVLNILKTTALTPELIGTSFGGIFALFAGFGKFLKVGKAINNVEKRVRSGELSRAAAKAEVKDIKDGASYLERAATFAADNVGFAAVVAGNTNDAIDAFMENNNGEWSMSDLGRIVLVESIAAGLDRFSGSITARDIPGLKGLVNSRERRALQEALEDLNADEYGKLLGKARKAIGATVDLGKSSMTEGVTEYIQTLGEIFNEKYATEKYGSDIAEILFSDESNIEALTGAAVGIGTGGQMELMGMTSNAVRSLRKGESRTNINDPSSGGTEAEVEATAAVSEEQRSADREVYRSTINNLSEALESEDFTPDSLGQMAQTLQLLNSVSYAANNTTPEQRAADKEVTDKVKELVVGMVLTSEDGSVPLSRTAVISEGPIGQEEAPVGEGLETETETSETPPTSQSVQDFTDAEKRTLVEMVLSEAARQYEGEIPADVEIKLHNFAETNNVNKKTAERILKSYASVELEATVEDRGVVTRTERLEQTLTSGTATKEEVQKQYDEAVSFYATTRASIDALEQGIQEAETKAKTLNKKSWTGKKKPETIKTKYMTDKESSSKGEPFAIVVSYGDDKRWHAHVAEAKKRMESKKRTARSLYSLLETFHTRAESYLDSEALMNTGGYVITQASGKPNDKVTQEQKYVAEVKKALNDKPINKVIVTEGRAKHWEPTGTRARINNAVTNTYTTRDTLYTADDVVYLHSPGTITAGGRKISELFKKSSDSVRELNAATDVGATIVLANDHKVERHRWTKDGKKESSQGQKIANVLKTKGYIPYGVSPVERNIFVPDNESNQLRLAERKAEAEAASKAKKEEKRLKSRFQKLAVEKAAAPLLEDARPMEEIEADLAEARAAIAPYFEKTALDQAVRAAKEELAAESSEETVDVTTEDTVVSEAADLTEDETSFDDGIDMDVVNLVASENLEENLDTYEETVIRSGIVQAKEALQKAKREGGIAEFPASEKSIEALVKESIRQDELAGEKGKAALEAWQAGKEKRLEGSKLREAINKGLEAFGFKVVSRKDKAEGNLEFGGLGIEILNNSLGSTIDTVTYNIKLKRFDDAGQRVEDHMTKFTPDAVKIGDKVTYKGKEHEVVSVNKVIHNPTSYLKSTRGTALNTIPVDMLPQVFKDMTQATKEAFKKSIVALTADEKEFSKPSDANDRKGQFNTIDSPARNLIFDKDGNVHESMFLAMAMSIGSVLNNEKSKLLPGPKNKKVVAAMFGIQEDNVTQAHTDFARKHGAYGMSVKETLGKGVLQALGISLDRTSSVGIHHYNRLVADLGNMVLRVAEEQGLLKTETVPSNELSKLIKGGETRIGEAEGQETTFVTIPHKSVLSETTGLRKNEPNATAGKGIAAFEEADEMMPDVTSMQKEPFFGEAPDKDYQARAVANIRNDLVESDIPADAKKMLKSSMNTKYTMNEKEVDKFFALMETEEGELKAKRLFGFIPIDPKDPEYAGLLYDQKIIQEYINDDIERSIEHLRKLRDQIKDGTIDNAMYFGFFYSGNQRYSIDANTINPQNDKLHRFFIQPEAHRVTYNVDRSNNSFIYEYVQNGKKKTIDSSLYVRAALAQAFGVKIDKTHTKRIIGLGNALLSLTQEQVDELKESYLNTGEMVLMVNGEKEIFEPDHPSHAFQALDFIHSYAGSTDSTFENSLTAEFDALTSGFANKVQQLATLEDLTAHANRVAVLRNVLNNPDVASITGSKTRGINDLLADGKRLDSYENLAQLVLNQLGSLIRTLSPDRQELFATLQELLPGGTLIGQAEAAVDSVLRSLFKPSFMIFNYSASVNRIVKNLGTEMVTGVLEQISKADFSKKDDPKVQAAMKAAHALAKLLPPGEEGYMSPAQFQELIRNESLSTLFVPVTEIKVGSDGKNEPRNLVDYLSAALIKDTYGKAVDTAFKTEFKDFIKIQDATNDMFKQAFTVFNQHLLNKVKKFREDPNNTVITEDILKGFIRDLRGAFPVIAGPLTAIIDDKANLAEGVHIYDTTVKSPNEIMSTGASPQSKFKDSKGKLYSRKSNPLIKSMIAAANAGAVLPFHAIDGAELATMVNDFVAEYVRGNETLLGVEQQHEDDPDTVGSGLLPLHDAYMGALPFADITSFLYNKGTYDINSKYSMMEEIYKMAKRTMDAVTNPDHPLYINPKTLTPPENLSIWKDEEVKEVKKKATKLIEEKKAELKKAKADKAPQHEIDSIEHSIRVHGESISFLGIFTRTFTAFDELNRQVKEARKKVYTEGTKIGTMAGFRGSIYTVDGPTEPSLEYLKEFHDDGEYKKTTSTVVKPKPASEDAAETAEQGGTGFQIPGTSSSQEGGFQIPGTSSSEEAVEASAAEGTIPERDFSGNIESLNQVEIEIEYDRVSREITEHLNKNCKKD